MNLDKKFHRAWHNCFGNLLIDEVYDFIEIVMKGDKNSWNSKELHYLREKLAGGKK